MKCFSLYISYIFIIWHRHKIKEIEIIFFLEVRTLRIFSVFIYNIHACVLSHVQLFAIPWTVAHQAPLSMGSPSQEYCSGMPFPPPGDLPDSEIEPAPPVSCALAGGFFTSEPPGKSIWHTAVLIVFIMLYIISQELTYFITASFLVLSTFIQFPSRNSGNHKSVEGLSRIKKLTFIK